MGAALVDVADMTVDTLNFVEGTGISIQTSPNPSDADILDIEISELPDTDTGGGSSPADDTQVWMPLVDSPDGTCVLDDTGLIPTLIPLT